MDLKDLGHRLRSARESRGLSQQVTADAVGVSRSAITQMELGNRSVSTLELSRLAECFRLPVKYFFDKSAEDEDVLVALYRMSPGLQHVHAFSDQVGHCLSLCREGVSLKRTLGVEGYTGPPEFDIQPPRSIGEAINQGDMVANHERRRLGIGDAPVHNMSELIVSQGIWASDAELPREISGLYLNHKSLGIAIVVNAEHSRGRKQFSYAHEYAHALLDRNGIVAVSSRDNSKDLIEVRANAFAASFLLPSEGVNEVLRSLNISLPFQRVQILYDAASGGRLEGVIRSVPSAKGITYKDIAKIAQRFGVSYQAALYRLKSLKIVNDKEMEKQMALEECGRQFLEALSDYECVESRAAGQRSDRELRFEVASLAIDAYKREGISRGRLLELSKILGIDGPRFLDFASKARGD